MRIQSSIWFPSRNTASLIKGLSFKSEQYEPYFVQGYPNSRHHTGWMVCPDVLNGFCEISKGMLDIYTRKGGTNRFSGHIAHHKKSSNEQVIQRPLHEKCRRSIADAAALAVILD